MLASVFLRAVFAPIAASPGLELFGLKKILTVEQFLLLVWCFFSSPFETLFKVVDTIMATSWADHEICLDRAEMGWSFAVLNGKTFELFFEF
jgi:hypothetical protein